MYAVLHRNRGVAPSSTHAPQRDGERSADFSTHCRLCSRRIRADDQRRHASQPSGTGCDCAYHVECLVRAYQTGRSACDCGENLPFEPIRIVVPRRVRGQHRPDQDDSEFTGAQSDLRSVGDECPICMHSLTTHSLGPIGRPSVCDHAFHLHCLIETAYTPARDRARDQSIDPDFPSFVCPICRADVISVASQGAPQILIYYEALEGRIESEPIFGNFTSNRSGRGFSQQQQQRNWWDVVEVVAEVAIGTAIVVAMILFARR
uniref:RING-type domain-containing protein n=1 Tax=Plectus sambesii TaxID=2011161 RepID=A0A914VVJ4_9BILA